MLTTGRYTCIVSRSMTEDRDRDEMQRLLAYANFSKVAEAVGVKRAAVANWAAGRHVTPARLEQVRALYGLPVTPEDTTEKEPPWVGRLQATVDSILANQGRLALLIRQPPVTVKPDERLAAQYLRELLAGTPQQPVEDLPEGGGSPDQGAPDRAAQ